MQPVGRPVGCNIAAMAPNGADLHAAERLPDILSTADVTIGHNDGAAWCRRYERGGAASPDKCECQSTPGLKTKLQERRRKLIHSFFMNLPFGTMTI